MIETFRACFALILCFTMATSPLQAPAIGTSQPRSARPLGWEDQTTRPSERALLDLLRGHSLSGGALPVGRTQSGEVAQLGSGATGSPARSQLVSGQTSTLLPDGRLLLLGGRNGSSSVGTAFIKNPKTGLVTQLSTGMQHPRYGHTATVLPNGTVLIFGGIGSGNKTEQVAELFDPQSLKFSPISVNGVTARSYHTATLLTDGHVLIAGGVSADGEVLAKIEFWNWKSSSGAASQAELIAARRGHTASLQADGTVLFWGGKDRNATALNYGEIYDPVSEHVQMQANPLPPASSAPPSVEASIPQDGDQNVALDTSIAVRFSKPLQVETVNLNTAVLAGPEASNVVVKVVAAEAGMLAFVTPQTSLLPGTGYTLTLSGATDPSGLALPDTTITFTTAGGNTGGVPGTGDSGGNPFNSPWRNLPPLHAPPGVTALAGQVLQLNGQPLQNVTLQIGNFRARSDATGRFLIINIPAGHQVMWIVADSANHGGASYGIYEDGVDITVKQTNVLKYTIWMTALDTAHTVTIPSPTVSETVVSNPLLPGLELRLPAGTVIHDWYGKVVTQINITPIPVAQPPFPLPAGVQVPIYFTIQPGGAYLQGYDQNNKSAGARLFYPNTYHLPAGARFDFWNYDADQKGWYVYGQGSVSSDTKQIIPDPGVVIYEFTGAMVGGGGNGPGVGPPRGNSPKGGDPIDLQTGLFVYTKTDLYLSDVIPIQLVRTYRQMDSASRTFGIGTSLNYDTFIVGDTSPYTYIDVIGSDGGKTHYDRTSSGTSWSDAVYQNNTSPSGYGSQIAWNGSGWTLTNKDQTKSFFLESGPGGSARHGALSKIVDRNGNTLTLTRDANFNLTQITSPNGRWIQLTYDSSNRVTQATDNVGRAVIYTYDAPGRLWTVTDANGGVTTFTYDANNNMKTIQDARGIVYLTNYYDSNNRVSSQVMADGGTYQFNYVNAGGTSVCGGSNCPLSGSNIVETDVTDPRNYAHKVTFNSDGYTTSDTHAVGTPEQQTITYNRQPGSGLILSETDALNRQKAYTYDAVGNVTTFTRLAGTANAVTTSYAYDSLFNQVVSVTGPLGHTTSLAYDSKGNLISSADPLGITTSMVYNSIGQLISVTDPLGNTTHYSYDGGDLIGITDPPGRSFTRITDAVGRLISITDPLGRTVQMGYNPLDQITSITDQNGTQSGFIYDPNGNILSLTDANQHTTNYGYDNMDRLQTRTDALQRQESYTYDPGGNLATFTDRRGQVTSYSYDSLNHPTLVGFGTVINGGVVSYANTIAYQYDTASRMTNATDSIAGIVTRQFDDLDRLVNETAPQGSVSYTYDGEGRRVSMQVAGQAQLVYNYDDANRLRQIGQGSVSVGFAYDNASRYSVITLPNSVAATYSYDQNSSVTGIAYTFNGNAIGDLTYSYDNLNQRVTTGGSFAETGFPTPVTVATYDATNELTSWNGTTMSYDANGNMLSDNVHTYSWDTRNHLAAIDSGVTATFVYDPFGRRATKMTQGVSTSFLYDMVNPVQELSGTMPTANLLTGAVDKYFMRTDLNGPVSILTDALNSTLVLTTSAGTVQTRYVYDPFGNTSQSGDASTNSVAFTARENDGIGLYYYRNRYYSPLLQRFISEDPIRDMGGFNYYTYAKNNPVSYTDPFGLAPKDKCERCPEGPQKCFDNCNEDYVWCQLTRGRVDGAVCLLQGPTQSRHGPITWPGDTCGLNFDADMCLHNKQWCHFGCRSKCYGPYPPTIKPPFVGPTHHTEVPWWKFWAS